MTEAKKKPEPLKTRAVTLPTLRENPAAKRYRANMPGETFHVPTEIAAKGVQKGWWKYACTEDEQREAMAELREKRRKAKAPNQVEVLQGVATGFEAMAVAITENTKAIQALHELIAGQGEAKKK